MKSVGIIYSGTPDKEYFFLCPVDDIEAGDFVAVETRNNGISVARVNSVTEEDTLATAWVIGKIDVASHEKRKSDMIRKKALHEKMHAELVILKQREAYAEAAERSETMRALLEEYDSIK